MQDGNEFSWQWYLLVSYLLGAFFLLAYRNVLFTDLPGYDRKGSVMLLLTMQGLCVSLGTFFTIWSRCTLLNAAISAFSGVTLYAIHSWIRYFPVTVVLLTASVLLVVLLFTALVMRQDRDEEGRAVSVWRRLRHALLGSRVLLFGLLGVALTVCYALVAFGYHPLRSDTADIAERPQGEWTAARQAETLRLLNERNWEQLSLQERMDVLGTVANIELQSLGVDRPVKLNAQTLPEDSFAAFADSDGEIWIDLMGLKDRTGWENAESICHECRHCYQHEVVRVLNALPEKYAQLELFNSAHFYREEMANYKELSADPYTYLGMEMEKDAREYAEYAVTELMLALYLTDNPM